ncbi:MAG: serine hydrolase domain-containing protein [Planctomycetota bacterium]
MNFPTGARVACEARRRSHLALASVGVVLLLVNRGVGDHEWELTPEILERIDEPYRKWDRIDSPGVVVGIVRQGELIYSRGFGVANLEQAKPLRADSVLYIASMSKQFTAAAAVLMALDGVIELDDDVRRWIPELPLYGRPVTIRHLLHHTSGLRDYGALRLLSGQTFNEYFDNDETVALLARQQGTNFPAGQQHEYCNSNYVLLAEVVERAAGASLQSFCDERLFKPLGMSRTRWGDAPRSTTERRVSSYLSVDASPGERGAFLRRDIEFAGRGDGNLWTTVEDLARWDRVWQRDVPLSRRGLGRHFIRLMLTRGQLDGGEELDYACGLLHGAHAGLATVSHSGGMFGYQCELLRIPDAGLSVIVLANVSSCDAHTEARRIASLVLKLPVARPNDDRNGGDISVAVADEADAKPTSDVDDVSTRRFAGRYECSELDAPWSVTVDGSDLIASVGTLRIRFQPVEENRFHHREFDFDLHFEVNDAGQIVRFLATAPGVVGVKFRPSGS